jgi:isocitrate/isopropylmalate dehydrogenase
VNTHLLVEGCIKILIREIAIQETIMSRHGVDRVQKFAFELAKTRKRKKLTNATKSNGISITMPFWDERFNEMKKNYPDIETDQFHIDILVARFVLNPEWFDVVVGIKFIWGYFVRSWSSMYRDNRYCTIWKHKS